jgi:hypothetical protein
VQSGDIHENARCPISGRTCQISGQLEAVSNALIFGVIIGLEKEAPGESRDCEVPWWMSWLLVELCVVSDETGFVSLGAVSLG